MKKIPDKAIKPKGKSLKEKIQRHLNDKDDVITEQDMKEVEVGVNAADLAEPEEPTIMEQDIPPKKTITPWDVIDDND